MPTHKSIMCFLLPLLCMVSACVKNPPPQEARHFETNELDSCLVILIDMSGSFAERWEDRAFHLFGQLMDKFFTEAAGSDCRVVIGQLSGNDDVLLFQGEPAELRRKFKTPDELNTFLQERSSPNASPIFQSTGRALDYVASMPDVTKQTRTLTVIMSDLVDSESDRQARSNTGFAMLDALKRYQAKGGGLALYFVAQDETKRWHRILEMAQFEPGSYVIENEVVENPQLPSFE